MYRHIVLVKHHTHDVWLIEFSCVHPRGDLGDLAEAGCRVDQAQRVHVAKEDRPGSAPTVHASVHSAEHFQKVWFTQILDLIAAELPSYPAQPWEHYYSASIVVAEIAASIVAIHR